VRIPLSFISIAKAATIAESRGKRQAEAHQPTGSAKVSLVSAPAAAVAMTGRASANGCRVRDATAAGRRCGAVAMGTMRGDGESVFGKGRGGRGRGGLEEARAGGSRDQQREA